MALLAAASTRTIPASGQGEGAAPQSALFWRCHSLWCQSMAQSMPFIRHSDRSAVLSMTTRPPPCWTHEHDSFDTGRRVWWAVVV